MTLQRSRASTSTRIGALGWPWRAAVSPAGTVREHERGAKLSWWVAADDRWHDPEREPSVRQHLVSGTPVVETRVKIPGGDAVQRVFAVADRGGMTVVEVTNDSTLPIAVAFAGAPLWTSRPPAASGPAGIELPADAVVLPIGHRSTVTVVIAPDGQTGALPSRLAGAEQVVRGWLAIAERAGRVVLPDPTMADDLVRLRCRIQLEGLAAIDDPTLLRSSLADHPGTLMVGAESSTGEAVLVADQLVRMGDDVTDRIPELAEVIDHLLRGGEGWLVEAALDAAERVMDRTGEQRALKDLRRHRARRRPSSMRPVPPEARPADGVALVAWIERRLACGTSLLPAGLPEPWFGQPIEVHGLPTVTGSTVSFAVRWHGARPAVLWEVVGGPCTLDAPLMAPDWRSHGTQGEALWPVPPGAPLAAEPVSAAERVPLAELRSVEPPPGQSSAVDPPASASFS